MKDWNKWHEPYADPQSDLSRRLVIVQDSLRGALTRHVAADPVRLISLCAGDGRDVCSVFTEPDMPKVHGLLVEFDPKLVQAGQVALQAAGLSEQIELREGDAAKLEHYADYVPADIAMLCGVFGNISDDDVFNTIEHLPQLVKPGATLIWTRSRRDPDLTPAIRAALNNTGFAEQAFVAPDDALFTVGTTSFSGEPQSLDASKTLFTFVV